MDLDTFIVTVFCLIDDQIEDRRLRKRGPARKLSDAEALTIEIVGEFLQRHSQVLNLDLVTAVVKPPSGITSSDPRKRLLHRL